MVRKRSRSNRKYYEENDSDSDFSLEESPSEPAPKKYSLRQRKRRLFTEFEFDDDGDEIEPTKVPSDDDDFEVDKEFELGEAPATEYNDKEPYADCYEPENEDMPEDADGLIDFEDMIRADIVVNKNRIDYDNLIQKTEIKVQPIVEPIPYKSKRGRKPKIRPAGEIDSSLLEPEPDVTEPEFIDLKDKDYEPGEDTDTEEPIDCAQLMQAELSESGNEMSSSIAINEINNETHTGDSTISGYETKEEETDQPDNIENNVAEDLLVKPTNNLSNENQDTVKDTVNINSALSLSVCANTLVTADEKLPEITKPGIVDNEDDDVVLIEDEKKSEVIVLDD